jgi:mRNA interferase RelE/StbE
MSETPKTWQVIVHRRAEKVLQHLPKDMLQRILSAIRELSSEPRPDGCKKLAGYDNLYHIRVGDWRVSYAVEADKLILVVLEISPRGGATKTL